LAKKVLGGGTKTDQQTCNTNIPKKGGLAPSIGAAKRNSKIVRRKKKRSDDGKTASGENKR